MFYVGTRLKKTLLCAFSSMTIISCRNKQKTTFIIEMDLWVKCIDQFYVKSILSINPLIW